MNYQDIILSNTHSKRVFDDGGFHHVFHYLDFSFYVSWNPDSCTGAYWSVKLTCQSDSTDYFSKMEVYASGETLREAIQTFRNKN